MSEENEYVAFISYNSRDEAFAQELQEYLEHYEIPDRLYEKHLLLPRHLRPIFRDRTALPIDCLVPALKKALSSSRFLISVCSLNSAVPNDDGKHYVDAGVRFFNGLDEQNIHCIVPVMFRDKETSAVACLLPAVKGL